MRSLPPEKGSLYKAVCLFILMFTGGTICLAQDDHLDAAGTYARVYVATQSALLYDPFIQNGVYYSYPYYNAMGHPFLDKKEFETGSVVFREKLYGNLSINYDLFDQQIILSQEYDGVLQMNLLDPEFVSGFELKGKQFVRESFQGETPEYFQVISAKPNVSCYYSWYKERREVRDSGNRSIYSFSDQKSRRYILLDGQLLRYKSNKSFLKIFPEQTRELIRTYLQENRLQVMEAGDGAMRSLIEYCDSSLDTWSKTGGA